MKAREETDADLSPRPGGVLLAFVAINLGSALLSWCLFRAAPPARYPLAGQLALWHVLATAAVVALWFCLVAPFLRGRRRRPAWLPYVHLGMSFTALIPGCGGVIMVVLKLLGRA